MAVSLGIPAQAIQYGQILLGYRTIGSFQAAMDEGAKYLGYVLTREHKRAVALNMGLLLGKLRESIQLMRVSLDPRQAGLAFDSDNFELAIEYAMDELEEFWELSKSL